MSGKIVPLQMQKQLKKETLYGCALCGCPILEFVHIVPYDVVQAFLPENMIAICPVHRIKFDNKEITEATLRESKTNPHNKIKGEDAFYTERPQEMVVNIGKCKFIDTPRVIVIDDFDIISIRNPEYHEDKKYLLFDINFFDKFNNLIAVVSENTWTAERPSSRTYVGTHYDWNISYKKPRNLVIESSAKNIMFSAQINNYNELTLTAEGMYYNGSAIRITEDEILLDDTEIAKGLIGTVFRNKEVGVVAESQRY